MSKTDAIFTGARTLSPQGSDDPSGERFAGLLGTPAMTFCSKCSHTNAHFSFGSPPRVLDVHTLLPVVTHALNAAHSGRIQSKAKLRETGRGHALTWHTQGRPAWRPCGLRDPQ